MAAFPRFLLLSKKFPTNNSTHLVTRLSSTYLYSENDPAPIFFNKNVQNLLEYLTRLDLKKVYQKRRLETEKPINPTYKFMTEDELQESLKEAEKNAKKMVQMPPVIKIRDKIDCTLSNDAALIGAVEFKTVFTDITYGVNNRDRIIVVRDVDGKLKKADWDVRDRINQIYFPMRGRELSVPKMFTDENLKNLLDRQEYKFILDRACIQFEPNEENYQKVAHKTYKHVDEYLAFDSLRSTRHFGPLVFFLCWCKNVDNILLDLLQTSQLQEAVALVDVYCAINKVQVLGNDDELIENFIKDHGHKKGSLELALQSFREFYRGLKSAHGVP